MGIRNGQIYQNPRIKMKQFYITQKNIGLDNSPDDCYLPPEKFPHGPRCKLGDWIIYSMYERQAEKINGRLCYFIADESVKAAVSSKPTAISVISP